MAALGKGRMRDNGAHFKSRSIVAEVDPLQRQLIGEVNVPRRSSSISKLVNRRGTLTSPMSCR